MANLRELWFVAPHAVELRRGDEDAPLEAEQIRLQALASGVSQGTELLLYRGEGPTPFDPSLDPPNASTYPRRYGYSWVGEVVASAADSTPVGARVFGLLPHGDRHTVRADRVHLVPQSVPTRRAVLAANLETAVTAVWDAEVSLGDDVTIFGAGTVGLLCGLLARTAGARRVRLVEPSLCRREAALALGFDGAVSPEHDSPSADADVVIEASGNPDCLNRCILHARHGGTLVVASFYGQRTSPIALGSDFHRRRLSLKASQVSVLPGHKAARFTRERRFALVLDLLHDARLDRLLDPPVTIDRAPATYAALSADPGASLQTTFCY